ncbi:thiol:disulfide interchange protein DsbA/DsbL [Thiomicrorhabdus indica]|uniref:thiol:disulfide interchange protein DsbA/DsbL n=1 Tax=Thiomicrorhabdus indica TaxID=2267253 RepID=UPI00102DCD8E|nr:thiol:disulfide interchange protein DsbA/DsbL [Thiomicrorhabdus indica]
MNRRLFLSTLAATSLVGTSNLAQAAEFELIDGVQYKTLKKPVDTEGKKTVIEVFGYTCPHCYHLEPSIHEWLKTKPENVQFERMPVVFNHPNWIYMARVFFTAKRLGVLEKSHSDFFHAIHRDKTDVFTPEALAKFFTRFGVEEKDFLDMFKSFVVDGDIKKAAKLTRQYEVEGVPAIIINGKYLTDVPMAKGKKEMWTVVDELIQK